MKIVNRIALALLLVVGLSASSYAQSYEPGPAELGIKGGVNFSNYNGDAFNDGDYKTRGNVGLYFKYDLNPYFALQPEANVSWTGAKSTVAHVAGTDAEIDINQTYIQIPVLAKLQLPTKSGLIPNIFAGPVVGFSIHDSYNIHANNANVSGDLSNAGLDAKTATFGLEFGAGVEFGGLMLDARYHWGLTDAFDNVDAQNGVFMIDLGVGI